MATKKKTPKKPAKPDPVVSVRPMDAIPVSEPAKAAAAKPGGKKSVRKPGDPKKPTAAEKAPRQVDDSQELVVFAFRLTRAERDAIHAAAGSAKASRLVRGVALAAARGDMKAVEEAIEAARTAGL